MTQEIARVVDWENSTTAPQLNPFHAMQQKIAEFYLTESVFPPGFYLPRHSHQYHCVYLVLDGSFSETQGSKDRIRERFDVVLTPIDQPHADTFHDAGGRCFFVEIPSGWAERVRDYSTVLESNIELQSKSLSWLMMRLDAQMLLDPFEEEFHLPATANAIGVSGESRDNPGPLDRKRRLRKLVGRGY